MRAQRPLHHALLIAGVAVAGLGLAAGQAEAQTQTSFGAAAHIGTLGLGGDVAVAVGPMLGFRGRVAFQPYEPSATWDNEIDMTVGLAPSFGAFADLYPMSNGLRVSAGLVRFTRGIDITGTPAAPVDFNGTTYQPSEIGSVTGTVSGRGTAPYLGIGWGNPARSRVGVTLDLGVAFYGSPQVELSATGMIASDPTFMSNLETEVQQLEADIEGYKYYPVLSVGVAVGLSR